MVASQDLESLPLLQAQVNSDQYNILILSNFILQVEVYQSDFNAERQARERIAGEKADLEEQLRKVEILF